MTLARSEYRGLPELPSNSKRNSLVRLYICRRRRFFPPTVDIAFSKTTTRPAPSPVASTEDISIMFPGANHHLGYYDPRQHYRTPPSDFSDLNTFQSASQAPLHSLTSFARPAFNTTHRDLTPGLLTQGDNVPLPPGSPRHPFTLSNSASVQGYPQRQYSFNGRYLNRSGQ